MNRMTRRVMLRNSLAAVATVAIGGCASSARDVGQAPTTVGAHRPAGAVSAVVYRSPTCGCCESWEKYVQQNGITVDSKVVDDVTPIKTSHHVPTDAQSCHTAIIGDYAIEGHVPVEAIDKLLAERPKIDGIAAPGMPSNGPGMGPQDGKLQIVAFHDGQISPFMTA